MGLNEAAGYTAVGATALATGYLAEAYGLRPAPFLLGVAFAALGLGLSTLVVRETQEYAHLEAANHGTRARHDRLHDELPLEELEERMVELPADREVVAYCRGAYCALAHDAVRLLTAHGRRARRATDDVLEWQIAGVPIQAAAA